MIDPQKCVDSILANPELAEPLFDLIVWLDKTKKSASDRATVQQILMSAYIKTEHADKSCDAYRRLRTG
jgi:hypothetical protein